MTRKLPTDTIPLKIAAENHLFKAGLRAPIVALQGDAVRVFHQSPDSSAHVAIGHGATIPEALANAGYPFPAPPVFAAAGPNVVRGSEGICVARSSNMARRIANALNAYTPTSRGA